MLTREQIINAALVSQDPAKLYSLVEQALQLSDFHAAQAGFSRVREAELAEQVKRQTAMIENLEQTLWGRK